MKGYNKRTWINDTKSSSTGFVVCYSGLANWSDNGKRATSRFIEVADCHSKVRIHQAEFETLPEYIAKIKKLSCELGFYIEYLRNEVKK